MLYPNGNCCLEFALATDKYICKLWYALENAPLRKHGFGGKKKIIWMSDLLNHLLNTLHFVRSLSAPIPSVVAIVTRFWLNLDRICISFNFQSLRGISMRRDKIFHRGCVCDTVEQKWKVEKWRCEGVPQRNQGKNEKESQRPTVSVWLTRQKKIAHQVKWLIYILCTPLSCGAPV